MKTSSTLCRRLPHDADHRGERILARVRRRQLDAALRGRFVASFAYARLALRIRRTLGEWVLC